MAAKLKNSPVEFKTIPIKLRTMPAKCKTMPAGRLEKPAQAGQPSVYRCDSAQLPNRRPSGKPVPKLSTGGRAGLFVKYVRHKKDKRSTAGRDLLLQTTPPSVSPTRLTCVDELRFQTIDVAGHQLWMGKILQVSINKQVRNC